MSKKNTSNLPLEWIDEIPTLPSPSKALVVSIAVVMLAGLGAFMWHYGPEALEATFPASDGTEVALEEVTEKPKAAGMDIDDLSESEDKATETKTTKETNPDKLKKEQEEKDKEPEGSPVITRAYLDLKGYTPIMFYSLHAFGGLGALCLLLGILSFVRIRITYSLLRFGLMLIYPVMLGYVIFTWIVLFDLMHSGMQVLGDVQDPATNIKLWWSFSWPALAIILYTSWLHAMLSSRSVYAAFTAKEGSYMDGDRVLEDFRTHGKDPRSRRSLYGSVFTHYFILIIIPFLLQARGCIEPYRPPKGAGENAVPVAVVKVKKKKKKKQLKLRPDSAIVIDIPPLDDTLVDKMIEEITDVQYETVAENAKSGSPGKGGGKGPPGWPEGQDGAEIRFIRLSHGGYKWDDGMGVTNADKNFMREFQKMTGFKKVRKYGESHPISHLDLYPDDGFPPFVFITGDGPIRGVSNSDYKILREYCKKGGMLIADAGSASFDRSFRDMMRKVFPGSGLLDIADDDRIYQLPFNFPNGAPEFWSHGGRRGMGIKHNNRWMVFYHPGDMNDAWKSSGYAELKPGMRRNALNLGINIVFYAFNEWNDAIAKVRK
jgi:hypothetical protein